MASYGNLREWFHKNLEGLEKPPTHMLIVRSNGIESDYPVYMSWAGTSANDRKQDIVDFEDKFHSVIEVYDLRKDFKSQWAKPNTWEIFDQ